MSDSNLPTTDAQDDSQPATTGGDIMVTSGGTGNVKAKNLDATDQPGPLEQRTGQASGKREMDEEWIHEILADQIYDSDSAFVREFLQNSETACIRACKTIIKHHPDGPGADWLTVTRWVDQETGETVTGKDGEPLAPHHTAKEAEACNDGEPVRAIEVRRKLEDIVAKARELGYDPVIEIDLYHEDRRIEWRDNGIGMTSYEVDEAFNVTGMSGVRHEGDTGGNKGIGTLTFKNVTGEQGDMVVTTRTRQPTENDNVHPMDHEGIVFDAYLGGWDELPNDHLSDDFRGTLFEIPAQDSFNLRKVQDWVETYTTGLRIPVLYQEHRDGSTPVKEEYGDHDFTEKFGEAPIVLDRPGEFSAVAGPDLDRSSTEDTWLVSMPIERNKRGSLSTFWKVLIQLHDEQGRIIAGPNRGRYHKDGKVYATEAKENELGDLQPDDVPLPEPTGDRDRLARDGTANKRFFRHVTQEVKTRELAEASEVAERLNCDQPHEAVRGEGQDWKLFKKMVNYHGDYNVWSDGSYLQEFLNDREELPDFDRDTAEAIYKLYTDDEAVSVAPEGRAAGRKKKRRDSVTLGHLFAVEDPEEVYMAASTSKAFIQRKKVVENTHDGTVKCVVVGSASDYDRYEAAFGWKKLKEVPREQSDDHDYDVPQSVHDAQQSKDTSVDTDGDDSDEVDANILKFRTSADNSSIDYRRSVADIKDRLENNKRVHGHRYIVAFTRGNGPNISDHYSLAKYAAITCLTKAEFEELAEYDRVMTYDEFAEFSKQTVMATEEGGYTVEDLLEMTSGDDGRLLVVCYAKYDKYRNLVQTGDDHIATRLREFIKQDLANQARADGKDPLFAVADKKVLERAAYAFKQELTYPSSNRVIGLRWSYGDPANTYFNWTRLDGSEKKYRRKARTPSWDDDSDIYDKLPRDLDSWKGQMFMAFHDIGVDPTDLSPDQLRDLMETMTPHQADINWMEVTSDDDADDGGD